MKFRFFSLNIGLTKIIPVIFIIICVITFFFPLFYPKLQIFVTPDFGQSDIFQLNLPAKYSLSQSLKNNELPFWNKNIGTGFPQLAEGQIGTFNIFNLLLFKFLPFPLSYNLGYVFIFLFTSLGTYLYCKTIKFTGPISLFCSLLFAFSGFFIGHIPHFNLIQTASYLPWIFFCTHLLLEKKQIKYALYLSLLFSQQYFAGFPQIVLITGTGIGIFVLYQLFLKNISLKTLSLFLIIILLTCALSAIQLIPSQEFLNISNRKNGLPLDEASYFSFPFKHFLTFTNPFALGNPKEGTYPYFTQSNGSVFWENLGYVGIIPLILLCFSIIPFKKNTLSRFYWIFLIISALLMLGKFSPIYFFYTIPPYSYFRVPSRFILIFVWSIIILSGYGILSISQLLKKLDIDKIFIQGVSTIIIILGLIQLFGFAYPYNPLGDAKTWLSKPESINKLPNTSNRYYTLGSGLIWNQYYLKNGWSKTVLPYYSLRNFLVPNLNLVYDLPSFQVYPILKTNRYNYLEILISQGITPVIDKINISSQSARLLSMNNVSSILSAIPVEDNEGIIKIKNTPIKDSPTIYENKNSLSRAYFVYNYKTINTINDFEQEISSPNFNPQKEVLLENKIDLSNKMLEKEKSLGKTEIKQIVDKNLLNISNIYTKNGGLFVMGDLFYPGWKAFIDNKQTDIFPANLTQRALIVPAGKHEIKFSYKPTNFTIAVIISGIGYITVFIYLIIPHLPLVQKKKSKNI